MQTSMGYIPSGPAPLTSHTTKFGGGIGGGLRALAPVVVAAACGAARPETLAMRAMRATQVAIASVAAVARSMEM
jgi:hypothetical protein